MASVAASRGTEPAKLSKLMKGELDWVLLKALEKDRTRRYDTANGLARDIQQYLANEVVEARPPSTDHRLKKFVRRHKGQVIVASLVLLALLPGMAGTTWGLIEAEKQQRLAVATQQAEADRAEGERLAKIDARGAAGVAEDPQLPGVRRSLTPGRVKYNTVLPGASAVCSRQATRGPLS